jgi:beta-lactam-binding protein with PASTA domain
VRRRRAAADEPTAVRTEEWPVAEGTPPPPVPPPDAAPGPPPGPPPRWLAVENPWPWLALVLVAVAALLVWFFAIRGSSDRATVPRVVGLSQPVAIKKLQDAGFNVTALRKPAKAPAGRVFAQKPGAGTQLKKKQTVVIDVSNGVAPKLPPPKKTATSTTATVATAPQVAVPDVKGKVQTEAGPAIEALGLVPDTFPVSGGQTAGVVVAQSPAAGTKIAAGKSVRLDVSTGGGNQPASTVPDVTGQKAADARAKLWAAKLTTRTVYEQGTIGVVLRQQPGGGGQAPAFSQVTLTVGR